MIIRPQGLCIFVLNQYKLPLIVRTPVICDHKTGDFNVVLHERNTAVLHVVDLYGAWNDQ